MCTKVAIIGVGQVGGVVAYALLRSRLYSDIFLVESKLPLRDGQVADLSDAALCEGLDTRVRAATYKEAGQADIVVITAGCRRHIGEKIPGKPPICHNQALSFEHGVLTILPGETNGQMAERSAAILRSIVSQLQPVRRDLIIVVVSNPVDVLTTLVQQVSGLPASQVIGSGTSLDQARLQRVLKHRFELKSTLKNLYVLGEHGDTQFVAWSTATVNGRAINEELSLDAVKQSEITHAIRHEAQHIMDNKGTINFGIGSAVAVICSSIVLDKTDDVLLVSHFQDEYGCCLSMPAQIRRKGVMMTVSPVLSDEEKARLEMCGEVVRGRFCRLYNDD